MKHPTKYTLQRLLEIEDYVPSTTVRDEWVPARPLGLATLGNRVRCAWLVFTGKADAVVWPEDEQ